MPLSSILSRFTEPETLKMAKLCRALRATGIDIIDLSLGEPDFDTPQYIKDAAKKAIDDNWSHYPPVAGYPELRQAISDKLKRDNGLDYLPEQIIVSTGAKQSIANAVLSVVDEDDEVIIPTPYWVSYSAIAGLAKGTVKFINAKMENDYKITAEELENAITYKSKLFIFSSPCNPTGAVYTKEELHALAKVFEKYPRIFIISDEIYEYINFAGKHNSIAQFENIKERVIIVNGFSKAFAMTGWRLGYSAASPEVAKACEKIQGQITSGTNTIAQRAGITALNDGLDETKKMIVEFKKRKEKVMELLQEIPLIKCTEPDGAFYVFPEVDKYFGKKYGDAVIKNSDDLCMYLINEAHVSTVTGKAFGNEKCIRISFANSMKNIEEGFKRIKEGLVKLK
ncbi:MAG: pyridoxal phosphate-dependent aminotransferase [Bacteroidota bacterium]|nr:pyridoxal phosphate-dependent aminotransferase [Bacteroidota bacterium]